MSTLSLSAVESSCARQEVVGVGCRAVSSDPAVQLVTYALGSCIAVTLYDPASQAGGLLHFMLPEAALDHSRVNANPYLSADTGLPLFLQEVCRLGAQKSRLQASLSGGAQILSEGGLYNMGKRNYLAARKFLWKAGILVKAEAVGGEKSRTVALDLSSGAVRLRTPGSPESLILCPNSPK